MHGKLPFNHGPSASCHYALVGSMETTNEITYPNKYLYIMVKKVMISVYFIKFCLYMLVSYSSVMDEKCLLILGHEILATVPSLGLWLRYGSSPF